MTFFSVIIAIHNAERYLHETLLSVQRQTFTDFEVVMVDDGSSDGSAAIARQFCAADSRFRLLSTPNQGISPTRNLAIGQARGEWLAICDADDTWDPRKLAVQAEYIAAWDDAPHGPLTALGTSGHIINKFSQVRRVEDLGIHTVSDFLTWRDEIGQMAMINSSVVCRRDLVSELGGYRADYTPAEDTDLWTRLAARGVVLNLEDRLTAYRMHGDNISESSYVRMMMNALRVRTNSKRARAGQAELSYEGFQAHLSAAGVLGQTLRRLRHERHYYAARTRWNNRRRLAGVRSFVQATLIDPGLSVRQLREGYRYRTRPDQT